MPHTWQLFIYLHSLHSFRRHLCSHILLPTHYLHLVLRLLCSHILLPPHSMHRSLRFPCMHKALLRLRDSGVFDSTDNDDGVISLTDNLLTNV